MGVTVVELDHEDLFGRDGPEQPVVVVAAEVVPAVDAQATVAAPGCGDDFGCRSRVGDIGAGYELEGDKQPVCRGSVAESGERLDGLVFQVLGVERADRLEMAAPNKVAISKKRASVSRSV